MYFTSGNAIIEVACPSALSWSKASNLVVETSATGYTRASYFGGSRVLRTMSLSHHAMAPTEMAKVEALTHLGYGAELGFIPTGAERANLLPPGASLLATVTDAIPRPVTVTRQGEVYPGGVNSPETKRIAADIPFPYAGKRVAISAVGKGGGVCSIEWKDATGAVISYSGVTASSEEYERSTSYATAPTAAVAFGAHIKGDVAAPSITLENVYPWQIGQAAKSVVIEKPSGEYLAAWDKTRAPLETASYTVKEVGDYV